MYKNQLFRLVLILIVSFYSSSKIYAQGYPKIAGYGSIVHPIITQDKDGTTHNFAGSYTVGFPFGLNILKSDHIGFSFEITPFIKAENGTDKVYNYLFHPGIMFRYPKGFTFISRMAFETGGRYGATAVFSKVIIRKTSMNYFIAVPVPIRFGNDKPPSIGIAFQFGISF